MEVKKIIDDWMNYYNNERYQWHLAKLSPNEYYENYGIKDLLICLKNHLETRVEVSDFLCEAINSKVEDEGELVKALDSEENEVRINSGDKLLYSSTVKYPLSFNRDNQYSVS